MNLFTSIASRLFVFTLIALVNVVFSFVSQAARADQAGPDYLALATRIKEARSACVPQTADCSLPGLRPEVVYENGHADARVTQEHLKVFSEVAKHQAQIWADTILEGDYRAAGDTRLDKVEAFFKGEELVAYRITYSERAWYTGECHPSQPLQGCEEGRIAEASFVSPTTQSWLRDDRAYADFISIN